ncbi:site-specific integrase [Caballeronia novacaledonica]|uniref:Site-specific integrase n=1 Tax=Caballeronia novacaledonica TaxID=1544861 RepID=A0ACB5QTW3_9BURK|nr:site-specific integrase [Caballeronia novacaledonica]
MNLKQRITKNLGEEPDVALDPTRAVPLAEWNLPHLPKVVSYYDKIQDQTFTINPEMDEWGFWYNGLHLILDFTRLERALVPLLKCACVHYIVTKGTTAEISKVSRLYGKALSGLLESPLTDVKTWWAAHPEFTQRSSCSMPLRVLLNYCISARLGHWALGSQSMTRRLPTNGVEHHRISNRSEVISAFDQAKVTRLLDAKSRCARELKRTELSVLVSLAWSFQYGMRPIQQVAVRQSNVRLYYDAKNVKQAHLVFHKAKQRSEHVEPLVRQMKPEWVPLLEALIRHAESTGQQNPSVLQYANASYLTNRLTAYLRGEGLTISPTPYSFRHTAAQLMADAGKPRELIQEFLGHSTKNSAKAYVQASTNQSEMLNTALGASTLYRNVESIATGRFASIADIEAADEDQQVSGFAGGRAIAGLGICQSGQPSCSYNPVSSCYGCDRFIPSANRAIHEEALAGLREQVILFEHSSRGSTDAPPFYQLTRPISVIQHTLEQLPPNE